MLLEVCELMGIGTEQAIAVGDGANDLPMMQAAGLSIAFHPKPAVREKALVSIMSGGMDRALDVCSAAERYGRGQTSDSQPPPARHRRWRHLATSVHLAA